MEHTTQGPIACAGCGAALAADQRYCLHCGASQGDPRAAYRELIDPPHAATAVHTAAATNGTAPAHGAPSQHPPARDWTPLAALGALGTLALVLVVGVLIGKSGTAPSPAAAPPPQVITINSGAPAAAAPADASADASTGSGGKGGKKKDKASDADPVDTKAGAQAVQDLNSASGDDYQKKSAKLPDTVALPGEPPPKDNKAPGGGSGAETIG